MELRPGALIDQYELIVPIGDGGMGTVWLSRRRGKHGFEKLLALKTMLPQNARNKSFREMLIDEGRLAAKIDHPNVCTVFDVGETEGILYIVLEYVDGEPLANLAGSVMAHSFFPLDIAVKIAIDVCSGLHAAHEVRGTSGLHLGVVHRDVSPQNILLSVRGRVKLIDFGVALARDRLAGESSFGGLIKGKVNYMAPEQGFAGNTVDRRADIWGVGANLYKLIAGRGPFQADSEVSSLRLLTTETTKMDPLPDRVPAELRAVIERALQRKPEDRFATAAEMREALEIAAGRCGYSAREDDLAKFVLENQTSEAKERRALVDRMASAESTPSLLLSALPSKSKEPSIEEVSLSALGGVIERSDMHDPPTIPKSSNLPAANFGAGAPELSFPTRRPPSRGDDMFPQAQPGSSVKPSAPLQLADTPFSSAPPGPTPSVEPRAGFMDVRALIAKKRDGKSTDDVVMPVTKTREVDLDDGAPATDIELAVEPGEKRKLQKTRGKSTRWAPALVFVLLLAATALILFAVAPGIAKSRAISAAAALGITLEIDRASVGTGGVELYGLHATMRDLPGVDVSADHIESNLSGNSVLIHGVIATIDGPATDFSTAFDRFRATHLGRSSEGAPPQRLEISDAKLTWKRALGDGTTFSASGVGITCIMHDVLCDEITASVGRVMIETPKATLGPWAIGVENTPDAKRVRVSFDPPVADGPSLLIFADAGDIHATLKIQRSSLAHLGVPLTFFGTTAAPDIEIAAEGTLHPGGILDAAVALGIYGLKPQGTAHPIDVRAGGTLQGDVKKPIELTKGKSQIGPFSADLTGTVTVHEGGVRLDVAWTADPISCERALRQEALSRLGQTSATLQDLAKQLGFARVVGTVSLTGLGKMDSSDPSHATFTANVKDSCGVVLFPSQ